MNILQEFDTIAAISTPVATGGVGVIRISGDKSFEIAAKISSKKEFKPNYISHAWILDGDKKVDEVLILPFKSPKSYTADKQTIAPRSQQQNKVNFEKEQLLAQRADSVNANPVTSLGYKLYRTFRFLAEHETPNTQQLNVVA